MPGNDRGNEGELMLHEKIRPFQPGNSLGGRPRGARNKLSRKFLEDCYAHWQEHGAKALNIFYREDPARYCVMMASIVPKEIEFTANTVAELDDTELERMITSLRAQIAQKQELPMLPEPKVIEHVERE
jgi:hypothetical protein